MEIIVTIIDESVEIMAPLPIVWRVFSTMEDGRTGIRCAKIAASSRAAVWQKIPVLPFK